VSEIYNFGWHLMIEKGMPLSSFLSICLDDYLKAVTKGKKRTNYFIDEV